MKTNYIPSLNGLRAVCIFMVLSDHLMLHRFIPKTAFTKFISPIFFNGGLGVGFFFVISGFLITSLLMKEFKENGTVSLKQFYLRRSLRIFPAYYLLLMIYFMLQSLGYLHLSMLNWVTDLTYTNQFVEQSPVETHHLWSLSVEEVFYFLWPILYIKVFRNISVRYLYVLILAFSFFRFYNYAYPSYHYSNTILSTGDALLIGCLAALHYKKISEWVVLHQRMMLLTFPLLALFVMSEVFAYHLVSLEDHGIKQTLLQRVLLPGLNSLFGNRGLFSNILIVLIVIYSVNVKNYFYKFLNYRIINYAGILSYSIYLWQQIFITDQMHNYHVSIPLIILLIVGCANASYFLVEKPFLRLKGKFKHLDFFRKKKVHEQLI